MKSLGAYAKKREGTSEPPVKQPAAAKKARDEQSPPVPFAKLPSVDSDDDDAARPASVSRTHNAATLAAEADDTFVPPAKKASTGAGAWEDTRAKRGPLTVARPGRTGGGDVRARLPSAAIGLVPPQVRRGKPNHSTEDLASMGFTHLK